MKVPPIPVIVDFLKYFAAVIGALTVILSFFDKGRKLLVGIWHEMGRMLKSAHRVDLKITPDHVFCHWQEGAAEAGEDAMLVYCKLYLTNVAPSPAFQILDVYIKKPFSRGRIFLTARHTLNADHRSAQTSGVALPFRIWFLPARRRHEKVGPVFAGSFL